MKCLKALVDSSGGEDEALITGHQRKWVLAGYDDVLCVIVTHT
jgi:hypothetical protein